MRHTEEDCTPCGRRSGGADEQVGGKQETPQSAARIERGLGARPSPRLASWKPRPDHGGHCFRPGPIVTARAEIDEVPRPPSRKRKDPGEGCSQPGAGGGMANPAVIVNSQQPCPDGYVRIVCISDTHGMHGRLKVPPGDVLVHAGDLTNTGEKEQVHALERWLTFLPFEEKIVIAGNHDVTLHGPQSIVHPNFYESNWHRFHRHKEDPEAVRPGRCEQRPAVACLPHPLSCTCLQVRNILALSENLRYLEDSAVRVCGLNFYGSPWTPEFCNWAWNMKRGSEAARVWSRIPEGTDVLVTHGPPAGYGDLCHGGSVHAGCLDLLQRVHKVRPMVHIFGREPVPRLRRSPLHRR